MIWILLPLAVLAMFSYMFWSVAFRLRRERLAEARKADRGFLIFSRKHRARFLLRRSFEVSADPVWEDKLVSRLHGGGAAASGRAANDHVSGRQPESRRQHDENSAAQT